MVSIILSLLFLDIFLIKQKKMFGTISYDLDELTLKKVSLGRSPLVFSPSNRKAFSDSGKNPIIWRKKNAVSDIFQGKTENIPLHC
jgi:hypothetical protein